MAVEGLTFPSRPSSSRNPEQLLDFTNTGSDFAGSKRISATPQLHPRLLRKCLEL